MRQTVHGTQRVSADPARSATTDPGNREPLAPSRSIPHSPGIASGDTPGRDDHPPSRRRTPTLPSLRLGPSLTRAALVLVCAALLAPLLAGDGTAAASVVYVCDGEVFSGYSKTAIVLDGGVAADPAVQKIVRGCTFRDSGSPGIAIRNARNVLIEGSTFENIRSNRAGDGVSAIRIPGDTLASGITIRGNVFRSIGADGIQMSDAGRHVENVLVEGNTFSGSASVGENSVDVKGVDGPIVIRANTWSGFRPCEKGQDCSGSVGVGLVVHDGQPSGRAHRVTITGNLAVDNTIGLAVAHTDGVTISGNTFRDSLQTHLRIEDVTGCNLGTNSFQGTGQATDIRSANCGSVAGSGATPKPTLAPVSGSSPSVLAPRAGLVSASTLGATAVPLRIYWSAKSVGSGASRFELQQRVGSGSYVRVALSSSLSTWAARAWALGSVYQERVRLFDRSGRISGWATSKAYRLTIRQETSTDISYVGSWPSASYPAYFGGAARYSRSAGTRATFRFSGQGLALVGPRGPTRGRAAIDVDGIYLTTIDLYASTFRPRQVLFARNWLTSGRHSVTIRVLGTAGRPTVSIDAFIVLQQVTPLP